MGFEVFFQCFGDEGKAGIARDAVRRLFPIEEEKSKPEYWSVRYDAENSCHVGVTPMAADRARLSALYLERPCGDMRLWESVVEILKMGPVVLFWPGGPPVVANEKWVAKLPADMVDSIGPARVLHSAEEILMLLRET